MIAGALVVCAVVVAAVPGADIVSRRDLLALLESLRIARQGGTAAVNAVVTSKIVFIAKLAISDASSSGHALLFRDEMDGDVWRELATALRHQTDPSPELKNVDRVAAFRLGKTADL